jgi:hypothetical protein
MVECCVPSVISSGVEKCMEVLIRNRGSWFEARFWFIRVRGIPSMMCLQNMLDAGAAMCFAIVMGMLDVNTIEVVGMPNHVFKRIGVFTGRWRLRPICAYMFLVMTLLEQARMKSSTCQHMRIYLP